MTIALHQTIDSGGTLIALCAAEGSTSHPWLHSYELNAGPIASRNLADALHLFTFLHGGGVGVVERAAERNIVAAADPWFAQAVAGFAAERAQVAQLIVAAGPAPGTPGDAACAQAVLAQRHALDTIAQSDRYGCAIGAAAALVLDWHAIRGVLDLAAERMGVRVAPLALPDEAETVDMLNTLPDQPRLERTLAFGGRQLLAQHWGLWDLLATRSDARGEF